MSITLNEDGTITRNKDGKLLAIASDGVVEWEHHMLKKKHEAEVIELLTGEKPPKVEPPEEKPKSAMPEPPKGFQGDLTPGYPEWVLETQGQEAYDERYISRGKDRYKSSKLTDEELEFQKRKGFVN